MNIKKILSSEENPLVSVVRLTDPNRIQRGMGFVYKRLNRRVKVIVTCRHNFMKYSFTDFQFLLGNKNVDLNIVSAPFYHENPAHDIVLCIAHDSERHKTAEFNSNLRNSTPHNKQVLYNSKCDFHPDRINFPFYVMKQIVFTTEMHLAIKDFGQEGEFVRPTNEVRKLELTKEGYVIYPSLGMKSVVGCSGSPIFDDDLNLYGMNVRGIGETDKLVYVPIAEINSMYKKIEADVQKYII